jgi:hypothetical protein
VELLVALFRLSLLGAAFTQSLVLAWRLQRFSATHARAAELAAEQMERLRAGASDADGETLGTFTRSSTSTTGAHVVHFEVVVEWMQPEPGRYALTSVGRRR